MSELDDLIAEQKADSDHFVRPEDQTVSLESVGEFIGTTDTYFAGTEDEQYSFGDEPNAVYSFLEPRRGDVLIEGASWHGTIHGYKRKKCRCGRCSEANRSYVKLHQRERRKKLRARRNAA